MQKQNTSAEDEYLTAPEVAAIFKVHLRTVQRYIASGKLRATRLPGGREYRIRRADAEAALTTAASA